MQLFTSPTGLLTFQVTSKKNGKNGHDNASGLGKKKVFKVDTEIFPIGSQQYTQHTTMLYQLACCNSHSHS